MKKLKLMRKMKLKGKPLKLMMNNNQNKLNKKINLTQNKKLNIKALKSNKLSKLNKKMLQVQNKQYRVRKKINKSHQRVKE